MEEQELIHVDLRLPVSALDGLSALAEQLRRLTAAVNGLRDPARASEEFAESGSFDPERFMALRQKAEDAGRVREHAKREAEALPVRSEVTRQVREAESAGREVSEEPHPPEREELSASGEAERQIEAPAQDTDRTKETSDEEIPAARAEADSSVPDAPAVRAEPDSQIPEAEKVWTREGEAELPLPAARADVTEGAETPLGAGMVVTAQAEPPASRWTGVTEELVTPGPAPLTAEAVSLAFQRDGRRYDNGFPLY